MKIYRKRWSAVVVSVGMAAAALVLGFSSLPAAAQERAEKGLHASKGERNALICITAEADGGCRRRLMPR